MPPPDRASDDLEVPPTDRRLMAAAGVLLAVPIVALLWVPFYARDEPELAGFPFFFWYQFVWVFLTSACTWTAYRLTLAARRGGADRAHGADRTHRDHGTHGGRP